MALASLKSKEKVWHTGMILLLGGGFIFQSLGLFFRGLIEKAFPLGNPFELLQVLAWSAIALDLVLRPLFRLRLLNFFGSGLAAILGLFSLCVSSWDYIPQPSQLDGSPWVGFHAALAVFSYAVFGVLAITSLMYIIQHHGLEARRSGGIFDRLPAIRQLEEINGKLIVFGVSILTISVIIGVLNWFAQPGTVSLLKVLVAAAVWGAYLAVLVLRKVNMLVAAPFAISCVMLFVGALISLWPLTQRNPLDSPADPAGMLSDAGP
ncbi:cytochrome c biogenesis protein CcsA [Rubellicoccus peritrichatus]|uniref:Cytochrome c biogenesis protein CcsA n=1 Tax=Rubellicoccus peritrichatus TaxID=3080537 RepID=A0AAQ3L7I6_9BACT|nr:cytochrome c biogenesis protein CcsA [Puniceicoccus sp. CR14]WOO39279.1 cytochrome c biogenesis protein CcsA [Puniceicoccus sp. CR14]